jgi:hypothetical protein
MDKKIFLRQRIDVLTEGLGMIGFQKEELRNYAYTYYIFPP